MKRHLALLVGVYLASLLIMLPAAWLIQHPHLGAVQGSLWRGQAQWLYQGQAYADLAWRIRALALLKGQLLFDVSIHTPAGPVAASTALGLRTMTVNLLPTRLSLDGLSAQLTVPLAGALELLPVRVTLSYQGDVLSAHGTLVWQQAALGAPAQPLGAFAAELTSAQGALLATLRDQQGPLALTGEARWHPKHGARLSTALSARDQTLSPWLALIGPADAQGWRHWQW